MKTIQKISNSESLYTFLYPVLGKLAKYAVEQLKCYNIFTVSQLTGLAQSRVPKVSSKAARAKGLTKAAMIVQGRIHSEHIISHLQRGMRISKSDAIKVYNRCIRVTPQYQRYNYNSSWAFGAAIERKIHRMPNMFWSKASRIRIQEGDFIVPAYEDAGPVFDQGERGTCVANAICASLNYSTGLKWSRQFFYHNAKMVDGIPDEEGTYIETAVKLLCDRSIGDLGNVEESVWPYNPHMGNTPHQGPPPEKSFNTRRVYSESDPVFIRESNKVADIKYLLNYQTNNRARTNGRDKTNIVNITLELYESFFSYNTSDTGWVTMPLPGEAIVGYHAMAICGYDDDRRLFLVRNSWGPHWAHNNDKGFAGHAWIPYEYIEKHCHAGVSIGNFRMEQIIVPENERLYNNALVVKYSGRRAASQIKKQKVSKSNSKHISVGGWIVRIVVVILLWFAYKDPIIRAKDRLFEAVSRQIEKPEYQNGISDLRNKLTN